LFVSKMTMDKEKHSSGLKGGSIYSTNSSSRDRTTNHSTQDLVKKLEDKERELETLKKKRESSTDKSSNDYYQLKYEKLYHENMIMKNELFELKNLIQRFKRSEASVTLKEIDKDTPSSDE